MENNTKEKSLIKINENSIFFKIKQFVKNLFSKKEVADDIITENMASSVNSTNDTNTFLESLKNTENEETLLLKLQIGRASCRERV